MKKILLVVLSIMLCGSFAFAGELDDLKDQINKLEKKVKSMSKSVNNNTKHTATDRVSLGVEFRTAWHSYKYQDALMMPDMATDMMQLLLQETFSKSGVVLGTTAGDDAWDDEMMTSGGIVSDMADGFNDAFMREHGADMMEMMSGMMPMFGMDPTSPADQATMMVMMGGMFSDTTFSAVNNIATAMPGVSTSEVAMLKNMFKSMDPKKYTNTNSSIFTNRLRIRMKAKVNSHLSFTGRLAMYKTWGDSSNVSWFDGSFSSMHLDGNSGAIPTDDAVRVERAYFVYGNEFADVNWHVSFGRRPSTAGFGMENKTNAPLGGSPSGHIIQWNFDGASLGFGLEEVTGIPGLNFKICYGMGYEGGHGTINSMVSDDQVDDVNMWGVVFKLFDNEDYRFVYNWAHAFGVTDGFVGQVAMPFYISGKDFDNDGEFDEFTFNPNYGGYMSRFEPTAEIGDVDMHSLIASGNTFDWSWFLSGAVTMSKPDGRSQNAMFQFMEQDGLLCGGDEECKDRTGYSVWAGIMTPELPFTGGKFGVEYNYGSKYWFNFTAAEDALTGSKLATRGQVYEAYYHQPIVGNRFFATLGYKYYDYDYTGSGSPLGAPVKIDDANAFNTMMPVKDKVHDFYVTGTFRY